MREPTNKEKSEILFALTSYFNCPTGDIQIEEFDIIVTPGFSHTLSNCQGPVFIVIWPQGAEFITVLIRNSIGGIQVLTDTTPDSNTVL